ncbi:MAG TPA: HAMP domain-containing sensor histidine kinase [Terriglobia bacterium]|nr:HAMP domain-containing sensor histidine kinase [Terriglobia bacterium]
MKNPTGLPPASASRTCGDDFLEILGSLAHKLSQPLTSLHGTVEVALMGELDVTECRRILEISLQETQRMAEALEALRYVLEMERVGGDIQPVSWTRIIEKILGDVGSVDKNNQPHLVNQAKGEVWVKANPQHLNLATARLLGRAVRVARRGNVVRIILSVDTEKASLAVFEEGVPQDAEDANGLEPPKTSENHVLGELDRWIINRAIERQGGRLNVNKTSETCLCYQLTLPLAAPEIARTVRP